MTTHTMATGYTQGELQICVSPLNYNSSWRELSRKIKQQNIIPVHSQKNISGEKFRTIGANSNFSETNDVNNKEVHKNIEIFLVGNHPPSPPADYSHNPVQYRASFSSVTSIVTRSYNKAYDVFISCLGKVGILVSPFLYLIDIGTDAYTAYQHSANGDVAWAWLTSFFMLLPKIVHCIKAIFKVIQNSEVSNRQKPLLVLQAICVTPFRIFYLIIANVIANLRGRINKKAAHDLGYLKLVEAMLESLPQSILQIIIIAVKAARNWPQGEQWEIVSLASLIPVQEAWQIFALVSSIISLAHTVSLNAYLFNEIPKKAKVVFFLNGIKTVFSRLAIFTGYVFLSLGQDGLNSIMWLLPLFTMLSASIGVWFIKHICHCCSCVLPLDVDVHYRCHSWGTIIMTWFLTAVYNGFTLTGLLLSVLNWALAVGAIIILYASREEYQMDELKFALLFTTPTAISVLINIILLAVPYCRHNISDHWLSINKDTGETILY